LNQKEFQSWVDGIYATEDDVLDCRGFQAVLPAYTEAKLTSQPFDPFVTIKVEAHLHNCPDCNEVYNGLKYVVQKELSEELVTALQTAVSTEAPMPDMTAAPPR